VVWQRAALSRAARCFALEGVVAPGASSRQRARYPKDTGMFVAMVAASVGNRV